MQQCDSNGEMELALVTVFYVDTKQADSVKLFWNNCTDLQEVLHEGVS